MKAWELKKYVKGEESKKQVLRQEECARLSADLIGKRSFAILIPTPTSPGIRDIGSCAFLRIGNRIFAATAGHVLDIAAKKKVDHILISSKDVFLIVYCGGIRRADDTKMAGGKVIVDAAVFELVGKIPQSIYENAFDESMLSEPTFSEWHVVSGFPYRLAKRSRNHLEVKPTIAAFPLHGPSFFDGERIKANIDGALITNLSYGFVNYGMKIENGRIDKMASLKGMSGGPIVRMVGIPDDPDLPITDFRSMKLTTIVVEQQERKNGVPPLLIATNIYVHLALAKHIISNKDEIDYRWHAEANMR